MVNQDPFADANEPASPAAGLESLGLAPWANAAPPSSAPLTGSWTLRSDSPQQPVERQVGEPLTRRELRERIAEADKRPRRAKKQGAPARAAKARPPKPAGRRTRPVAPPRALATRPTVGPTTKSLRKRVSARLFSVAAMMFSGALMLGMSIPAMAINPGLEEEQEIAAAPEKQEGQTLAAISLSDEATAVQRDGFGVTSYAELMRLKYGNRSYNYNVNWTGPVRWPFPFAVAISSGFGDRAAPCRGCSVYHRGIDLTPGFGQPIYAMADGIVSDYDEGWTYGNHVFIDHVIDGQKIRTLYAHMQMESSPLVPGQEVTVGEFVGLVGNTGSSSGPHLHFEVRLDGTIHTDPYTWLNLHTAQ